MEARPAGLQVVRTKAAQPRKAALLADGGEAVGQRDGGEGGAAAEDRHWAKRLAGRVREVREEPLRRPGPASCRLFGQPCAPVGLSHDGLPPTSKPSGRGARPPHASVFAGGVGESKGESAADTHGRRWCSLYVAVTDVEQCGCVASRASPSVFATSGVVTSGARSNRRTAGTSSG